MTGNDLFLVWCKTITLANADLLSNGNLGSNVNLNQNATILIQENALKNVVCNVCRQPFCSGLSVLIIKNFHSTVM